MLITRQMLEEREAQQLAPYATLSKHTRGRFHHDHESAFRLPYQRDRDRILHSAAFRRLEYKTQVFVNDAGDYYRTRLTHSLEVAQIGRTIARALGANEDLTEAICLAHDLGHPPFGHAGEAILNQLMAVHGGFNHNHQSYRVVTELEERYPNWRGLNLSYETLEGIAKHETDYDLPQAQFDYQPQASLEAQIANLADELAYNAHDLDDGLQADVLSLEQVSHLALWKQAQARLAWQGTRLDEVSRHLFIREIVGILVEDVMQETARRLEEIQAASAEAIQRHTEAIVAYSPQVREDNRHLKQFLYQEMYYHYRVVRMKVRAELIITGLFEAYTKEPRQLPRAYQLKIQEEGVARMVADYIACMTDRSALLEYQHLFDPQARL